MACKTLTIRYAQSASGLTMTRRWRHGALLAVAACLLALPGSGALAACVSVPTANLRAGPGTGHAVQWKVFRYMPVQVMKRRGDWMQVRDVDGDQHYVHRKLLSHQLRCAVVKAPTANVRRGPGTHFAPTAISPVERYYAFRVLKTTRRWARVQDEVGNRGWVARSLLWIN